MHRKKKHIEAWNLFFLCLKSFKYNKKIFSILNIAQYPVNSNIHNVYSMWWREKKQRTILQFILADIQSIIRKGHLARNSTPALLTSFTVHVTAFPKSSKRSFISFDVPYMFRPSIVLKSSICFLVSSLLLHAGSHRANKQFVSGWIAFYTYLISILNKSVWECILPFWHYYSNSLFYLLLVCPWEDLLG